MATSEPWGIVNDTCLSTASVPAPLGYSFWRLDATSMRALRAVLSVILLVPLAACGDRSGAPAARSGSNAQGGRATALPESSTGAPAGATGGGSVAAAPAPDRTGAPRALFIGTSLTAGLGLDDPATESWPAVVQQLADSAQIPLLVVNAGLSGETSAGALRRVDWLMRERYDLVVIETGANDGLRGLNWDSTAANITGIVAKVRTANPGAKILLAQMEAPTNMGPRYTKAFHDLFPRVALQTGTTLLPFILQDVGGIAALNQGDGIHPTAEGARIAAHNLWPGIRFSLRNP